MFENLVDNKQEGDYISKINNKSYAEEDSPILPMEENTREDELFTKDLQEELEAKFDELFGSIDTKKNN